MSSLSKQFLKHTLLGIFLFPAFALAQTIHVDATPDHAVNTFVPTKTLGAGIDRIKTVATDKLFTDAVMN